MRSTPEVRAKENDRTRELRAQRRTAKLDNRPPCANPKCGAKVTRDSKNGRAKLPKYCTRKCMRAAVWDRYVEKNGHLERKPRTAEQRAKDAARAAKSRAAKRAAA